MRTTLNLDDQLLMQAKSLAAKERTSLTRLIEEGLAQRLRAGSAVQARKARPVLPVFTGGGGLRASITDNLSQRGMLDAADEADPST